MGQGFHIGFWLILFVGGRGFRNRSLLYMADEGCPMADKLPMPGLFQREKCRGWVKGFPDPSADPHPGVTGGEYVVVRLSDPFLDLLIH
jgi:hypothetical protein